MTEVVVGGEHCQIVVHTKLGKQGIDGSGLDSLSTTAVAELGSLDVIFPARLQHWKGGEPAYNLVTRFRASEALEEFLQYQAGCTHHSGIQRSFKLVDLGQIRWRISPQSQ